MTTRRKPLPNNVTFPKSSSTPSSARSVPSSDWQSIPQTSNNELSKERTPYGADEDSYDDFLDSYYAVSDDDNPEQHQHQSVLASPVIKIPQELSCEPSHEGSQVASKSMLDDGLTTEPGSLLPIEGTSGSDLGEPSAKSKARLKIATALEDTSLFLGGLIKHPVETNRHFSILRHSHGLVYFKGPNTNIAFSIFSDNVLPTDRRIWLQLKGWSGHTGMAAKALVRANSNWINVTPEHEATAEQVPPLDERAWQRDINKFQSKADKTQQKHVLRETIVIRIPYEASDGYFRVVLTTVDSRRMLCPSPVFRVASTSMSASSLKGASLRTLPLELGVKVAQTMATTVATNALTPFVAQAKDQVMSTIPGAKYTSRIQTVWDASGAQEKIERVNEQYDARQEATACNGTLETTTSTPATMKSMTASTASGPAPPFPIRISGKVSKGTGSSQTSIGTPTANLDDISPDLLAPLPIAVYFGWAYVSTIDKKQLEAHTEWRHAVVTITHSSGTEVARRKVVRAYLIHDFPEKLTFVGAKLKLVIMGHLRPLIRKEDKELLILETVNDVAITRGALSQPEWGREETLQRIKSIQSARSMTEKMVDLRVAGQRQLDKVPIHMLGVRSDSFGSHDRGLYGNGGLSIRRDL